MKTYQELKEECIENLIEGKKFSGLNTDKKLFHSYGEKVTPHKVGDRVNTYLGKGHITAVSIPTKPIGHKDAEWETLKYRVKTPERHMWVNHESIEKE